jgi:hypothetical protein
MDPNFVAWPSVEPYDWLHYDYKLVMYHLSHGFSKDLYGAANLPTDIKTLFTIGQRIFFNSLDIDKLNILYNCDLSEILKIKDAHSLALKSEKNVTQVLFPNTTSEKAMFSKPETGVDTSSTTQDDNSFSKSVVENNTILAQPV